MEQKKELAIDDSQIESVDNEAKTIELFGEKGLCDQLIEKIMSMPAETRDKFTCSVVVQSPGLRMPRSGFGAIEITPAKVQLMFSPVRNK